MLLYSILTAGMEIHRFIEKMKNLKRYDESCISYKWEEIDIVKSPKDFPMKITF